jgi:hypothetical protein
MGGQYLPWQELLSWELLAIPAAAAAGILLNVHKTLTSLKLRKNGRGQLSVYSMTTPFTVKKLFDIPVLSRDVT